TSPLGVPAIPRSPQASVPHAHTLPPAVSASVCCSPAASAVAPSRAAVLHTPAGAAKSGTATALEGSEGLVSWSLLLSPQPGSDGTRSLPAGWMVGGRGDRRGPGVLLSHTWAVPPPVPTRP